MRAFFLILVIFLGTVAYLVQTVVTGYDRQFSPPGPVRTWQVQALGDGREVVTVWGRSFGLPADEWSALASGVRVYIDRLPGLLDLTGIPGEGREGPAGPGDQGSPADEQN